MTAESSPPEAAGGSPTKPPPTAGLTPDTTLDPAAVVADLQRTNARLGAELAAARADVESLQNALLDVTPLRRHVLGELKSRVRNSDARAKRLLGPRSRYVAPAVEPAKTMAEVLDSVAATDRVAIAAYANEPTSSVPLRVYERGMRALKKLLRSLLDAIRRRRS